MCGDTSGRYGRSLGLLGVVVAIVLLAVAGPIDATLFGAGETNAAASNAMTEALRGTPLLAVVLLLGNGVAVPIAEEQVWRGIVQTELVASWGVAVGILLTAVLFALKWLQLSRIFHTSSQCYTSSRSVNV